MAVDERITKSVQLSKDDEKVLKALEKKLGLNFSNLVRLALRELAETKGLKVA